MTILEQFNDYVAWCAQRNPKPTKTDVGLVQTNFGLDGKMGWQAGNKMGGDHSYFTLDNSIVKIGSKAGVPSLEGKGTHFDGPKTGEGIGLGSFKLKLMRPGQNDTSFTVNLSGLVLADGDTVNRTFKVTSLTSNPNWLNGFTTTQRGKTIGFLFVLKKERYRSFS